MSPDKLSAQAIRRFVSAHGVKLEDKLLLATGLWYRLQLTLEQFVYSCVVRSADVKAGFDGALDRLIDEMRRLDAQYEHNLLRPPVEAEYLKARAIARQQIAVADEPLDDELDDQENKFENYQYDDPC